MTTHTDELNRDKKVSNILPDPTLTLYTLPNAPSPSSPIISHLWLGSTSLVMFLYAAFLLADSSPPNRKNFRKLFKIDILLTPVFSLHKSDTDYLENYIV